MLIDNCVTCHRTGGIGPLQMTNYDMVKGFAPMIREVVRTKRMPPWHADPHVGVWDGRPLADGDEKQDAGPLDRGRRAARQGPRIRSPTCTRPGAEWPFGKPDMVVELPAFDVPATGVVDYQRHVVPNTLGRDVWVRATDVIPGDRTVVHHVIIGVYDPALPERERMFAAPARPSAPTCRARPDAVSAGHGRAGAQGQNFAFQMHYTTSGKAAHDVTAFGVYFRDSAPKYEFKTVALANPKIKIPPNTKEHAETITQEFPREMILYRLTPHAHFRGRASEFVAIYPDGKRGDVAVGAEVRLQLADDVHAGQAEAGSGGHEHRAHHGLRQLVAEPGEPGPEPDGAVGRAVVRRDAVRRRAVPRADAGRHAGAGLVGRTAVGGLQPDFDRAAGSSVAGRFPSSLAFISTFMNRSPVASSRVRSIQRRPTTEGIQNPGVMLVR